MDGRKRRVGGKELICVAVNVSAEILCNPYNQMLLLLPCSVVVWGGYFRWGGSATETRRDVERGQRV